MILNFDEYNSILESNNNEDYHDIDSYILESLFSVMENYGPLTDEEVSEFLDTIFEETGTVFNTDVYESYGEWLSEYSDYIYEGVTEDGVFFYTLNELMGDGTYGARFAPKPKQTLMSKIKSKFTK